MRLKPVFGVKFRRYGSFWWKNLKTVFGTTFPTEKVIFIFVVHFCLSTLRKYYFSRCFENIVLLRGFFFWKNCFKTSFPIKKVIFISVERWNFLHSEISLLWHSSYSRDFFILHCGGAINLFVHAAAKLVNQILLVNHFVSRLIKPTNSHIKSVCQPVKKWM